MISAKPVRLITGPMGPALGPVGPVGPPPFDLVAGDVGPIGIIGHAGATGPRGLAGNFSGFIGPTGKLGPEGGIGPRGNKGPTGQANAVPDPSYQRYFENKDGVSPLVGAVGCKFKYELKALGYVFVFFTGLYTATTTLMATIQAVYGLGVPPDPGGIASQAGGVISPANCFVQIKAAVVGQKIPFFIPSMVTHLASPEADMLPQERWYDLSATHGTSSSDPLGGKVSNISCVIFEVPSR